MFSFPQYQLDYHYLRSNISLGLNCKQFPKLVFSIYISEANIYIYIVWRKKIFPNLTLTYQNIIFSTYYIVKVFSIWIKLKYLILANIFIKANRTKQYIALLMYTSWLCKITQEIVIILAVLIRFMYHELNGIKLQLRLYCLFKNNGKLCKHM